MTKTQRSRRGPRRVIAVTAGAVLAATTLVATLLSLTTTATSATATSAVTPKVATAAVNPAAKPGVPATGAYLGAWVDPGSSTNGEAGTSGTTAELEQLGQFQASIGRPLAIIHTYQSWELHVQNQTLAALASQGAIPMIDWACGDTDNHINSGDDDTMIQTFADQLAQYNRPVFLRWYWEFNWHDNNYQKCVGQLGPAGYAAAFQHIWRIFQAAGATNVAFVWCPSAAAPQTNISEFYPGNAYVDWIGVDSYDRDGTATFSSLFSAFYTRWAAKGKPMMVAETGAIADQATYLGDALTSLPASFPDIKAFLYFDGVNNSNRNWALNTGGGSTGFTAYAQMANTPYFEAMP